MYRRLLSLCTILLFATAARAQFRLDMGASFSFANKLTDRYTVTDPQNGTTESAIVTRGGAVGICLAPYPKYHFLANDAFSISAGAPLAIGYGVRDINVGSFEEQFESSGVQLAYELSVAADINFGIPNPKKSDDAFGAYFGVGFGVQRAGLSLDGPEIENAIFSPRLKEQSSSAGFLAHGAVMVNTPTFPLGFGAAYRRAASSKRLNFLTVTVFYPL